MHESSIKYHSIGNVKQNKYNTYICSFILIFTRFYSVISHIIDMQHNSWLMWLLYKSVSQFIEDESFI